jgi:hypothetical protein
MKKVSKNMLFNIFLVSFLFGVFLNNYFLDYKITFIVLLFISIFLLNLIIYIEFSKKYLVYFLIFLLSFISGTFTSQKNLGTISKNNSFIETYDSNFNNTLKLEIINVYKIKEYEIEYISKLTEVNDIKLDSKTKVL